MRASLLFFLGLGPISGFLVGYVLALGARSFYLGVMGEYILDPYISPSFLLGLSPISSSRHDEIYSYSPSTPSPLPVMNEVSEGVELLPSPKMLSVSCIDADPTKEQQLLVADGRVLPPSRVSDD